MGQVGLELLPRSPIQRALDTPRAQRYFRSLIARICTMDYAPEVAVDAALSAVLPADGGESFKATPGVFAGVTP
jgi:hypothetical protein